jgi:protein involved in sex pheromone biosynthesis
MQIQKIQVLAFPKNEKNPKIFQKPKNQKKKPNKTKKPKNPMPIYHILETKYQKKTKKNQCQFDKFQKPKKTNAKFEFLLFLGGHPQ